MRLEYRSCSLLNPRTCLRLVHLTQGILRDSKKEIKNKKKNKKRGFYSIDCNVFFESEFFGFQVYCNWHRISYRNFSVSTEMQKNRRRFLISRKINDVTKNKTQEQRRCRNSGYRSRRR